MYQRILGIDPGTKYMGVVVLDGRELLSFGVHTLRNGERSRDVISQARRIVLGYVAKHGPEVVAIEKPLPIATRRGALMNVIVQELRQRANELNLQVLELGPTDIRKRVNGNPKATKIEVAERLVAEGYRHLRPLVPKKPKRSALGLRPKDKYWLHMFDALAVAIAVHGTDPRVVREGLDGSRTRAILGPAADGPGVVAEGGRQLGPVRAGAQRWEAKRTP